MAKVIVSFEDSVIQEMTLDKERVTIGRKPQNDIQIENPSVSGEHARIVTLLNSSFLEDVGSTNGTSVNGNPIKKHILRNNDVIAIGKYTLTFINDAPASNQAKADDDAERTIITTHPHAAAARASVVRRPEPAGFFARLKSWFK